MNSKRQVEYIHKKNIYIFPIKSKIYINGQRLIVEANNRRITEISKYQSRPEINRGGGYKIGLPITKNGSQLADEYKAVTDYILRKPKLDFLKFEYATSHDMPLCTFFKSADSVRANNLIHELGKSLPFLINIFRRPLIHLKENNIIQPIDAVKRVNHDTVRHLSVHAEDWKSIEGDTIIPARLLTKVYDDDYSIYENVVFRDLMDKFMLFLKKRIYHLTEVLETFKESIQLDAINKLNHQGYYLAIGKLYVGFSKMENSSEVLTMLENTKNMYKQITRYKGRAVYTKNAHLKAMGGEIKKTNILTMHKDYKHVFSLYQKFNKKAAEASEAGDFAQQNESQTSYEIFCEMLVLFAVSNFNMSCDSDDTIYDGKLNAVLIFKNWSVAIKTEYNEILDFNTISMTVTYMDKAIDFLFIPISYYIPFSKKAQYENIVDRLYSGGYKYSKYIFLEPFDYEDDATSDYSSKCVCGRDNVFYATLPASITDINSFRRIQKILFEAMIKSSPDGVECAFCGEKLQKDGSKRYCQKCRTAIREMTCNQCGRDFTATYIDIKTKNRKKEVEQDYFEDLSDFYKQEKLYSFRNITNIHDDNFVCPHCGAENKK